MVASLFRFAAAENFNAAMANADPSWQRLVDSLYGRIDVSSAAALEAFLEKSDDPIEAIRSAFVGYGDHVRTALWILRQTPSGGSIFDPAMFLPGLISAVAADIPTAGEIVLAMPRQWVIANIEGAAEPLLSTSTDLWWDYYYLMILFEKLDTGLAFRLAKKALESADPDVRERGAGYFEGLAESEMPQEAVLPGKG
jgi:hypothetical protein